MFDLSVSLSPIKSPFSPLLFSGDLEEGFRNVSRLGYSGVDLSLLDSDALDQDWIIEETGSLNLKVYTIATGQTYYNDGYSLYGAEVDKRDMAVTRIKSHIDFASRLGAMVIIGGVRGKVTARDERERLRQEQSGRQAICQCLKHAEDKGVTLLLEPINRYETNVINTLHEGVSFIEEVRSDNLKLLPDVFHMNIEEKSIEESILKYKSHIGFVHFADSNRHAPGFGHIDFRKILAALIEADCTNAIGMEMLPEPDDFSAAMQAVAYIRKLEGKII